MSRFNLYLLLVTTVIAILSSTSKSIRFELESGNTKCIAEDIKSNSMTVGKYSIVNPHDGQPLPDSYKLTVRVTSSYGNNYHHSELVESGQFALTASEAGDYMACFWAADHKPAVTLNIDFDRKTGVAAKDWTNVAKKGSVDKGGGTIDLEPCLTHTSAVEPTLAPVAVERTMTTRAAALADTSR
ncbi:transmembrane emp24 domain-containing protein p24delta9-like isoform X3 [Populus nigra]|uniref:transmembrane emp24 domain-containing protein p24delta9-like isoform X3 n=1 Tax=Populus nigra TaxID=3691 RepID=UPI002B272CA1|nr:transmembrane emp24 domain-containing protein p24delta9-like isoform X3 [Populus nigra]